MHSRWTNLLVGVTLLGASAASLAGKPQETVAAFHAALAAGDQANASALLAPEILIYEAGFVERSRAEYASHHMAEDMAFAKTATRNVLGQGERIDGNLAVVWEETRTKGMLRGREVQLLGTETTVLEKKGDAWVIVHANWSSRKAN